MLIRMIIACMLIASPAMAGGWNIQNNPTRWMCENFDQLDERDQAVMAGVCPVIEG